MFFMEAQDLTLARGGPGWLRVGDLCQGAFYFL